MTMIKTFKCVLQLGIQNNSYVLENNVYTDKIVRIYPHYKPCMHAHSAHALCNTMYVYVFN